MEPLFIEQASFEKVAGTTYLSQEAVKWNKEILDAFFTEFPFFMSENIDLEFKKKDEDKGYAVGSITVGNLTIPVVVNGFILAPFDLVYDQNGVLLPLTQAILGSITKNTSAFKRVMTKEEFEGTNNLFTRPLIDLQPAANMSKTSMISEIADTITREQQLELLSELKADPSIAVGFETNGNVDVLAKIAAIRPQANITLKDTIEKALSDDIHFIEKVGRFKYQATFGNSSFYNPVVKEYTEEEVEGIPKIKAVGATIEKNALFSNKKGASFNVGGNLQKLVVMNVDGMRKHAYVDTDIVSDTAAMFGGEFANIGDYGVFAVGNDATEPFEVVGMIKNAKLYEITGLQSGSTKRFIPLRSVEKITPHENEKNAFYIPMSSRFVRIGDPEDITMEKEAEFKPANFYVKDSDGFYTFAGPTMKKYAEVSGKSVESIPYGEAVWALLQCKSGVKDVEKLASAPQNVRMPIMSDLKAPEKIDKLAEALKGKSQENSRKITKIAKNLIKEASVITDKRSVDTVLSLNLVTKDNIMSFVQQLDMFEQVLSDMARMLLMVRLGLSTIPELALTKALKGLSEVVVILRGMKNIQK